MKIPTTALLSIALVITTLGAMSVPTVNVKVTNFPLDAEGNIRTSLTDKEFNVTVTNLPLDEQGNLMVNITEKPLQIYKDAVEITVLDWTARALAVSEYGVGVWTGANTTFLFIFNPKPELLNVIDLWISIVGTGYDREWFDLHVILNDHDTLVWRRFARDFPDLALVNLDPNQMRQRINVLKLRPNTGTLTVYKITVFIEYEHRA